MESQVFALRPAQAAKALGIGLSTLWAKAKADPKFPQPVRLGPRVTVFKVADISRYIDERASTPMPEAPRFKRSASVTLKPDTVTVNENPVVAEGSPE